MQHKLRTFLIANAQFQPNGSELPEAITRSEKELVGKIYHYLGNPGGKTLYNTIKEFIKVHNLQKTCEVHRAKCIKWQVYQMRRFNYDKLTCSTSEGAF